MTRRSFAALAALATLSVPAVAVATDDWCPPTTDTTTTSSTPATTTTVPTSSSVPATDPGAPETTAPAPTTTQPSAPSTTVPGPVVDPIPEPPVRTDWCVETDGDGVGSRALSVSVCFTTPEAELWVTTVWHIAATYGVSVADANVLLLRLLLSL